jgi:hypothetical protein
MCRVKSLKIFKYSKMSTQAKMSTQIKMSHFQLYANSDPIFKFLANGGSWADAVEMEYTLNDIPKWSKQLQAAFLKHSPSAKAHQQRLIEKLREAYAYCGISGEAFEAKIQLLRG